MLCAACPHRKVSEGGIVEDGKVPRTAMLIAGKEVSVVFGRVTHPCHLNPKRDCSGHLRDLKEIHEGATEDEHAIVSFALNEKIRWTNSGV